MAAPEGGTYLRAFVSSTFDDLREHRAFVIEFLRNAGIFVDPMEDWTADSKEPRELSTQRVEGCDLCVLLVACRRGFVPPGHTLSITQQEYERARQLGMDILVFLLDETAPWYREYDELRTDELLRAWRDELSTRHTVGFFGQEPKSIPIAEAVARWLQDLRARGRATPVDELRYLRAVHKQTAWIPIRGLKVGAGRAYQFSIRELFIPLSATGAVQEALDRPQGEPSPGRAGRVDLHESLREPRLVIVGDPGAGKTTFLRRIACELCERFPGIGEAADAAGHVERTAGSEAPESSEQGPAPAASPPAPDTAAAWLDPTAQPLPVFIRLSDLNEHIRAARERGEGPTLPHLAGWLPHFLAEQWREACPDAGEDFFRGVLDGGRAVVLLDGLDEAPSETDRHTLVQLIEAAVVAYPDSRFVVTGRPTALAGQDVLPGWAHVGIAPLEMDAVEVFLRRWCGAIFPDDPDQAADHLDELLGAVRGRPDIRRLARNPVMLTALAVVHWNKKRLPEQRADLYDSIIVWLAGSRDEKRQRDAEHERLTPDRCVGLLQNLALAMQSHPEGRQVQVRRRWAAEQIAAGFREHPDRPEQIAAAERFLAEEELDSGIVVARGEHDVRFWHLTFQEFLAARALAALADERRREILLDGDMVYRPEWREVFLLLAGILHHHGMERVDQMIGGVLDRLGSNATLADRARCAGLLGATVRDLTPLNYRPDDPRYQQVLDQVLDIFHAERSRGVPIADAIAAADALGQAGDPRFHHRQTDDLWVTIPAGEFWMGAQKTNERGRNHDPEAWEEREAPVHRVHLESYRIGRYPVTVDRYRLFVENEGYADQRLWQAGGFGEFEQPGSWETQLEHPTWPVTEVSWYEAQAYCRWAKVQLPTEAQWERAARSGDDRRYPWGSDPPNADVLNYSGNVGHPTPVGVYPRGLTPEGIADMAGNVWEWCADWFGSYNVDDAENPTGPEDGERRVCRGGGWVDVPRNCRVSGRFDSGPADRNGDFGFRVVRVFCGQDS